MKKNIHKNLWGLLKSKAVLGVSAGLILMSCGAYTGGYSETDGVYYDPNTDTLPQGTVMNDGGNRVGEYYDYQDSTSIVEKSRLNQIEKKNRYRNENWAGDSKSSDWGNYTGSEINYNSWGYPYGFGYPRYGWGSYYGMSFGWGSPWGYYDPFFDISPWGYYSPWGYSPYFGYNPYYGYYSPYRYYSPYGYGSYYGYGSPYYGNTYYNRAPMRKSGADGLYNGSSTGRMAQPTSGMRTGNTYQRPAMNGSTNTQPRMRSGETMRNGNINRTAPTQRQMPRQERPQPRFENRTFENRTFENRTYDSGGFRSGGYNSGSSSSGSSRGSGMRTGGGRF